MENDDPRPETKPAGNRPPPRPPHRVAVGLGPEDDDSNKKSPAMITKSADGEGKFIRPSGGRNQYGHVILKVEPNGRGNGTKITNEAASSAIPAEYFKPVTEGVRAALDHGMDLGQPAVDGHPMVDVVVHVVGGSFQEFESSELAFKMAAIFAIKDAIRKADPIVIE